MMHCPSCGKPANAEQQFCRQCGMALQGVSKLVAAHSSQPTTLKKAEQEKTVERRMFSFMTWAGLLFLAGLVMLVLDKNFDLGRWFSLTASLFLIAGMAGATFSVFRALREGSAPAKEDSSTESVKELKERETKSLPSERIPVPLPSVTERTTELIGGKDRAEKNE